MAFVCLNHQYLAIQKHSASKMEEMQVKFNTDNEEESSTASIFYPFCILSNPVLSFGQTLS